MAKLKKAAATNPDPSLSQSKVQHLKNGNIEIAITIPKEAIAAEYQKKLQEISKTTKLKGFRPGHAPSKLVEDQIGKVKIYQEMAKSLLTLVYLEAIKTHKLKPVANPKFKLVSSEENQDWQIIATTAELPTVKLGNYKEDIKKALSADKIWIPGKNEKTSDQSSQTDSEEKKITKALEALLASIQIDLPEILIENEVSRMLSRLLDQTGRLGLSIEEYLASVGKTSPQLREEYRRQASETIKLEIVLAKIADEEKILVSQKEVEKMINAAGDEKIKKELQTPAQKAYIRQVLRKRKVIDNLINL
ncbi:MAG: hypothetical protein JW991_03335 [Candidatus Pacebacteria bacterium]|nr:hypothetical protein [Candidatus Paceibacterota bacterium]